MENKQYINPDIIVHALALHQEAKRWFEAGAMLNADGTPKDLEALASCEASMRYHIEQIDGRQLWVSAQEAGKRVERMEAAIGVAGAVPTAKPKPQPERPPVPPSPIAQSESIWAILARFAKLKNNSDLVCNNY